MTNDSYKMAIVGNADAILPFQLIGVQTFPVTKVDEAVNTIRQLAQRNFGIIYLTEDFALEMTDTLEYYRAQLLPALIVLPSHKSNQGLGMQSVREMVEKAVGQDILD